MFFFGVVSFCFKIFGPTQFHVRSDQDVRVLVLLFHAFYLLRFKRGILSIHKVNRRQCTIN